MKKVNIDYFSDILCIWAYINQIKIEELQAKFKDQITINYHFTDTFYSVAKKLSTSWGHRGGNKAYASHVQDLQNNFSHIKIHPNIWTKNIPNSSSNAHLFLKAISLSHNNEVVEKVAKEMRKKFFEQNKDITRLEIQLEILDSLSISHENIIQLINNGKALELVIEDHKLCKEHFIPGSPSFSFNSGRQVIYGNVGYRIIELNISELLSERSYPQSWC